MAYTERASEIPLSTFLRISLYGHNLKFVFILDGKRRGLEYVILLFSTVKMVAYTPPQCYVISTLAKCEERGKKPARCNN